MITIRVKSVKAYKKLLKGLWKDNTKNEAQNLPQNKATSVAVPCSTERIVELQEIPAPKKKAKILQFPKVA